MTGTTRTGFAFDVPDSRLDNMELVDALADLDENPTAISDVVRLLMPEAQRKALYDHVRTEDGRVPINRISEEIKDIFSGSAQAKK